MLIDAAPESPTRSVPAFFMQSRKMPRRFAAPMRHSLNHATRANAKRPSRGQSAVLGCFSNSARAEDDRLTNRGALNHRPSLRHLPEGGLRQRHNRLRPRRRLCCRPRSNQGTWERYEADEAWDLAHSEMSLPCDRFRHVHPSSLTPEKEVHLLDAESQRLGLSTSTSQSRHSTKSSSTGHSTPACDVDRGCDGDFSLDKIRHDEPVYFIRPQRRARKSKKALGHPNSDPFLQLDLSFSDLGDDIAIAHLLTSSFQGGADGDEIGDSLVARPPGATCLPLKVVYELADNAHSKKANKTEPHPESDSDRFSDYDCLSDSELVDDFSQHELEERTGDQPTEVWIVLEENAQ